jgi:hypothetical protein
MVTEKDTALTEKGIPWQECKSKASANPSLPGPAERSILVTSPSYNGPVAMMLQQVHRAPVLYVSGLSKLRGRHMPSETRGKLKHEHMLFVGKCVDDQRAFN